MMRFFLLLFLLPALAFADDAEVVNKANETNSLAQKSFNSKESINKNFFAPMTTDSKMKTLDGEKSFDAQAACVSTNKFLSMAVQPLPSGDVKFLSIQQDTDMDGNVDATQNPPWLISGVCANGFISCDKGTWNNCRSNKWYVKDSGVLDVEDVAFSDLGGCYCINNNCGTGLAWSNLNAVLASLGGGASAVLANANPFYRISDVKTDDISISYYGQDGASCKSYKLDDTLSDVTTKQLVSYRANTKKINNDAYNKAQSSTIFGDLKESQLNSEKNSDIRQCSIKRHVPINETTLNDIIGYESGTGNVSTCGSDCLLLTLGKVGYRYWSGNCTMYQHNVRFYVKQPERILSAKLHRAEWDDWIQVHANNQFIWSGPKNNWTDSNGPQPGACELSTLWKKNLNVDFTDILKKKGPVDFRIRVEVTGRGQGYARASVKVDTSCYLEKDELIDTCGTLSKDNECELVEEEVDGVMTFKDSISTGVIPLPQTKEVSGSSCSFNVKRDWFEKKRKYRCKGKKPFDYDDIIKRKSHIEETATKTEYEDVVKNSDTGETTYEKNKLIVKEPVEVGQCTNVCKTRKARPQNDASVAGVTGSKARNPITYDFAYHECGVENTCPNDMGEEIIKDCQCMNEFSEATAIMQSMRMAGQDIICSSGELKRLD